MSVAFIYNIPPLGKRCLIGTKRQFQLHADFEISLNNYCPVLYQDLRAIESVKVMWCSLSSCFNSCMIIRGPWETPMQAGHNRPSNFIEHACILCNNKNIKLEFEDMVLWWIFHITICMNLDNAYNFTCRYTGAWPEIMKGGFL